MGGTLNAQLAKKAADLEGKAALTSPFGIDCFALVDKLLRGLGANSAQDFQEAKLTKNDDYIWGAGFMNEKEIVPGDIIQFRDHVITEEFTDAQPKQTVTGTIEYLRPHHTAIVITVNGDGSYWIIEQNVKPNRHKVKKNLLQTLDKPRTVVVGTKTSTFTASGGASFFHPVSKSEDGASVKSHLDFRGYASVVPGQGGAKRGPGPLGRAGRRDDSSIG